MKRPKLAPGTRVWGAWPKRGVTFDVRRGAFVIPAELFEEGREDDLARHFAQRIPDEAEAGRRERLPGGGVRIHWRITHVVTA